RFRDQPSPSRDSPPKPGRVAPPQLPLQPRHLALCDHRGDAREGKTIMNMAQTGTPTGHTGDPRTGDPRIGWSTTDTSPAPLLHHRRDGILPTVAAALSVRGATLTGTPARADTPPALHPLVQDFLDTLTSAQRDRFTGRCAETILISRHLTTADAARSKRAARKPMTNGEARKALKHAKLTTRRIREDGDPLHGALATPSRPRPAPPAQRRSTQSPQPRQPHHPPHPRGRRPPPRRLRHPLPRLHRPQRPLRRPHSRPRHHPRLTRRPARPTTPGTRHPTTPPHRPRS